METRQLENTKFTGGQNVYIFTPRKALGSQTYRSKSKIRREKETFYMTNLFDGVPSFTASSALGPQAAKCPEMTFVF